MDKKRSDLLVSGYQGRADDLKIWTRRGQTFWSVGATAEQMTLKYGQEEVRPFGQWVPEQSRRLKNMDKKKSDLLVCGY